MDYTTKDVAENLLEIYSASFELLEEPKSVKGKLDTFGEVCGKVPINPADLSFSVISKSSAGIGKATEAVEAGSTALKPKSMVSTPLSEISYDTYLSMNLFFDLSALYEEFFNNKTAASLFTLNSKGLMSNSRFSCNAAFPIILAAARDCLTVKFSYGPSKFIGYILDMDVTYSYFSFEATALQAEVSLNMKCTAENNKPNGGDFSLKSFMKDLPPTIREKVTQLAYSEFSFN